MTKKSKYIGPRMHFPHKLYILMRNDIPSMNAGKAMAQAAHAANVFVEEYCDLVTVQEDWMAKGRPFGTTIVLAVNAEQLSSVIEKAERAKVPCGLVCDETYPFVTNREIASLIPHEKQSAAPIYKEDGHVVMFRKEITCGYLFVVDGSSDQTDLVGELPLYP